MSLGTIEQRTEGIKKQAQQLIEQAYYRGFKAGREYSKDWEKDQADRLIEQGMNMAWDAARKLVASYSTKEIMPFFGLTHGTGTWHKMITEFSPTEAIDRIRAYEEQKKQEEDAEIKVGDEVIWTVNNSEFGVITRIDSSENAMWIVKPDGLQICASKSRYWKKTGRTFPQIAEVLKKMQIYEEDE